MLETTIEKPNPDKDLLAVGVSQARIDGAEKVTGEAQFAADLKFAGMLTARLITSPYAHARIKEIKIEAALAVPGVVRVVTAADLPIVADGSESRQRTPLAQGMVKFYGQPVAVVLGETEGAALDGAALVEVIYEALPVAASLQQALANGAPLVQDAAAHGANDDAASHNASAGAPTEEIADNKKHPNTSNTMRLARGDVNAAFAEAAAVAEYKLIVPMVHQSYLETQSVICVPTRNGGLDVYSSTQAAFGCRKEVASVLGIALNKVKVTTTTVGGAFGGKFVLIEPLCAALAWLVKRPVNLTLYRMEDLLAANPAPNGEITLKMAAMADGTLSAMQGRVVFSSGLYSGSPYWAAGMLSMCYRMPNFEIEAMEVLTNKVGSGAYRAPGAPQVMFATEVLVDDLAHQLGRDPLEFRLQNCIVPGDLTSSNKPWPNLGLKECLQALQTHPLYVKYIKNKEKLPEGEGIGIAAGGWGGGLEPASALCRLDQDGHFTLTVGISDISGVSTSLRSIAAEILGLTADKVTVAIADTSAAPYAGASGGSKTLYTVGAAVLKAAEDAREQIKKIAATMLEASPQDIDLREGKAFVKGLPSRAISLEEIATRTMGFGQRYEPVLGQGSSAQTRQAPGFTAHLAHLHVDKETGEVTVLNYVAAQDVGKAINPAEVEGQIHGGLVQGLGIALYEEMVYDETGTLISGSLMDYALQTSSQVPANIEVILIESPSPDGPFGARGVGEPSITPGGGAVSNAIFHATGKRVTQLPATPERIVTLLNQE